MRISCIIPTLGERPEMLQEALTSIRLQTVPLYEVIVIQDKDRSYGNQARKLNKGVLKSKGDWFFFMGDDDMLKSNFVEVMTETVEDLERRATHPDIVSSRFQNFEDNNKVHSSGNFPLCSTIVKRSMYDKTNGYTEATGPGCDVEFYFQCLELGAQWHKIDDVLFFSRVHKGQFSPVADWSGYTKYVTEKYKGKYA